MFKQKLIWKNGELQSINPDLPIENYTKKMLTYNSEKDIKEKLLSLNGKLTTAIEQEGIDYETLTADIIPEQEYQRKIKLLTSPDPKTKMTIPTLRKPTSKEEKYLIYKCRQDIINAQDIENMQESDIEALITNPNINNKAEKQIIEALYLYYTTCRYNIYYHPLSDINNYFQKIYDKADYKLNNITIITQKGPLQVNKAAILPFPILVMSGLRPIEELNQLRNKGLELYMGKVTYKEEDDDATTIETDNHIAYFNTTTFCKQGFLNPGSFKAAKLIIKEDSIEEQDIITPTKRVLYLYWPKEDVILPVCIDEMNYYGPKTKQDEDYEKGYYITKKELNLTNNEQITTWDNITAISKEKRPTTIAQIALNYILAGGIIYEDEGDARYYTNEQANTYNLVWESYIKYMQVDYNYNTYLPRPRMQLLDDWYLYNNQIQNKKDLPAITTTRPNLQINITPKELTIYNIC